jgi:hypothetical protein
MKCGAGRLRRRVTRLIRPIKFAAAIAIVLPTSKVIVVIRINMRVPMVHGMVKSIQLSGS